VVRDDQFPVAKIAAFQYVTAGVFVFLLAGYWDLQVRNEGYYNARALANQIKSLPIPAPRGRILDRDGRVLVDNHNSFRLILSRENLRDEHVGPIAQGLNLDAEELRAKIRRFKSRPTYFTIPLKEELSPEELTFVEAHRGDEGFPEIELIKSQYRIYPREGLGAHLVGYVGEINEAELNSDEWAAHNPGDVIGKMGIERYYNAHLTGTDGQRRVRVDNRMNTREVLGFKEASPGRDLRLTIDLDLQAVAELAMAGRKGAAVALDPRNGEVLAFVSTPAYDPNHFAGRINSKEVAARLADPEKPFLNRGIQAQLAPGSTFKPVVAMAALEEGIVDAGTTFHCPGGATFYGRYFRCHKKGGHGAVNLHRALAQSCDVYFYTVGNRLGIDKIAEYAELSGFGKKTGIDLPHEKEGVVPSSTWKIRNFREKWYAGETISVAIGQGALTATPLQLAYAIGGLVNGGFWYRPHLVREEKPPRPVRTAVFRPVNVALMVQGLCAVINEGGTGAASRIPGLEFCGKTGTAQRASLELLKSKDLGVSFLDDAWFVGFAPREEPEIVVAALFENGEHGNLAGPIVRDVVKAYFDKKARSAKPQPPSLARGLEPSLIPRHPAGVR
jgi:penicillin-binding protein 2